MIPKERAQRGGRCRDQASNQPGSQEVEAEEEKYAEREKRGI
jgi:hypothetical protein